MNFTIKTRFQGEEHDMVAGLIAARAGRNPFREADSLPRQLRSAALRRAARVSPKLARRARLLRPSVSIEDFGQNVEALTGDPLTFTVDEGDLLRCSHSGSTWVYPPGNDKRLLFAFLTAVGPERWSRAKYTMPGFVDLEPHDLVVDCGAFVGGFTRAALDAGAAVIAVEPSRMNVRCLERNVRGFEVDIYPVGLGPRCEESQFQESSTGVDSTFGKPDEGVVVESYPVEILTVDELCDRAGVQPNFLKVEAEGMEVRVLEGMRDARPEKIAVDASPEGGSDDRAEIAQRLRSLGYTVKKDVNMIYGRRRP